MHPGFQALAALSTGIYFSGLTYFKLTAADMPPLRGSRPWHLVRELLGNRMWVAGSVFIAVGAAVQTVALTRLSLFQAQPMFLAGLAILLVLAVPILRERLTSREWGCVLLLGIATALFAHAVPADEGAAPGIALPGASLVVAVALPSLLVASAGFLASDLSRKGAHARPLTGVALAINVGILTGTGEVLLTGAADIVNSARVLATTPYLYLFAVTALLALGQLQIALQRSRLAIVGLVATATAKTYLLIVATVLYGEGWPDHRAQTIVALALSVLAVAAVPHHERRTPPSRLDRSPCIR
ncbi:hypothetical protein ACQPZP_20695 [Spirillospora sp. CA-142024]|uniref:hypothetical protein n=1 Tax=Spirillospora sp. CA-142024 TaxID=3240036 RepID=UPI003D8B74CC